MCAFLHKLPELSETSTVVPDQQNITVVTPASPASADEPQVASECSSSRCDVDMYVPNSHYSQSMANKT